MQCRRQLFIHIRTHKYAMHHFSRNSSTIENFWKQILFRATLNSIFSRVIRLKSQDRQILLFAIGILTLFECRLFAAFYIIACIQTMRYCLSVFLFFARISSLFHQLSSFLTEKCQHKLFQQKYAVKFLSFFLHCFFFISIKPCIFKFFSCCNGIFLSFEWKKLSALNKASLGSREFLAQRKNYSVANFFWQELFKEIRTNNNRTL